MRLSDQEKRLAQQYSKIFSQLGDGNIGQARQTIAGVKRTYPDYDDYFSRLSRRLRFK